MSAIFTPRPAGQREAAHEPVDDALQLVRIDEELHDGDEGGKKGGDDHPREDEG